MLSIRASLKYCRLVKGLKYQQFKNEILLIILTHILSKAILHGLSKVANTKWSFPLLNGANHM